MNRLAAGIVMTCKGMPFFQAGEEFARTKHGEGNSFKSSWQLNKIDWTRALEQEELVDYYRGLLALRRKFQAYGTCEPDCKKTFFRENQIAGYELEYPDGHAVCVFYNPWEKEALQKLPEGNWKLLCDGKRCAEDGAEMKESMMLPANRWFCWRGSKIVNFVPFCRNAVCGNGHRSFCQAASGNQLFFV